MNPQKIIIKFPPGSGGMFLTLLINNLYHPTVIDDFINGHSNMPKFNFGHTGHRHFLNQEFLNLLSSNNNIDIKEKVRYINQTVEFYSLTKQIFIFPTHIIDVEPLAQAFCPAKIIEIKHTVEDRDQLAFNLLKKNPNIIKYINDDFLPNVKQQFKRLISTEKVDKQTDEKLLTYIIRFGLNGCYDNFNRTIGYSCPTFDIQFADLHNAQLMPGIVNDLINFIDSDLLAENTVALETMINQYATYIQNQPRNPWNLTINDYN